MKWNRICAALLTAGLLYSAPSSATTVLLDFEGAGDLADLLNFYNGGTDSLGNSGTNYGISFGSNALSIVDTDDGGSGDFANEPSLKTAMALFPDSPTVLNMAKGFTTLSFYYSSARPGAVKVYDHDPTDPTTTSTLLAKASLTAQHDNNNNCTGDPTGEFCNWTLVEVTFNGIARSAVFEGEGNYTMFDNIKLSPAPPPCTGASCVVPEPASVALFGIAFLGLGLSRRNRI